LIVYSPPSLGNFHKLTLSTTSLSSLPPVPTYIYAALADPSWRSGVEEKYDALITNNTWDHVPHRVGSNIVTEKLIFKHKFKFDGTLERYKTRWVLHSFTQRPSIDYDETFSPGVKLATVCMVLSMVVSRSWPVHQLDVKNIFLHSTLSETVYCSQPMGFVDPTQPD
jgi:hypothetical protein